MPTMVQERTSPSMNTIAVRVHPLDLAKARGYLAEVRAMLDEAIATRDPRVMRIVLAVLQRQRGTISQLFTQR